MKFQIGDKVKVLSPKRLNYSLYWLDDMNKDIGKISTIDSHINECDGDYYAFGRQCNVDYFFHEENLELVKEEDMQGKISWICTNSGELTIIIGNKSYSVTKDHINYDKIKKAIGDRDSKKVHELANVTKTLNDYSNGTGIEVKNGLVYRNGQPLHNVITTRILSLYSNGFPIDPMVKFLDNLMQNPSMRAVEELYPFLERQGLPITSDGCFLGYKRVTNEYLDLHTRKFSNKVGQVLEVERNTVSDNWRENCASGFHVGSLEYVRTFGSPDQPVVICKVNPKDVVSVPTQENTKLRTCKYEVVGEYDRKLIQPMPDTLHSENGEPMYMDEYYDDYDTY